MWQHILFDFDGTLADTGEGVVNAARHAMESLGFPSPDVPTLQRFIGPPLDEIFPEVCGFNAEETAQAVIAFKNYYAENGPRQSKPYPGIKEMLVDLQQQGKTLHVATSKPKPLALKIMDDFGLRSYFTVISGSDVNHPGRPKAEVVREVLDAAGIAPGTAVMVGDRLHDVHGAHKNSLPCIGVLFGYGGRQELTEAGAEYIAEDVAHLQHLLLQGA